MIHWRSFVELDLIPHHFHWHRYRLCTTRARCTIPNNAIKYFCMFEKCHAKGDISRMCTNRKLYRYYVFFLFHHFHGNVTDSNENPTSMRSSGIVFEEIGKMAKRQNAKWMFTQQFSHNGKTEINIKWNEYLFVHFRLLPFCCDNHPVSWLRCRCECHQGTVGTL